MRTNADRLRQAFVAGAQWAEDEGFSTWETTKANEAQKRYPQDRKKQPKVVSQHGVEYKVEGKNIYDQPVLRYRRVGDETWLTRGTTYDDLVELQELLLEPFEMVRVEE